MILENERRVAIVEGTKEKDLRHDAPDGTDGSDLLGFHSENDCPDFEVIF